MLALESNPGDISYQLLNDREVFITQLLKLIGGISFKVRGCLTLSIRVELDVLHGHIFNVNDSDSVRKKKKWAAQGLLFLYGVSAFAVASTEYVTVNLAPLSVWNATAFPTKSMLPDAIGLA